MGASCFPSDFAVATYQFLVGARVPQVINLIWYSVRYFRVSMKTFRNHIYSLTQDFKFFEGTLCPMWAKVYPNSLRLGKVSAETNYFL